MKHITLFIFCFVLFISNSIAASFDCHKATSNVEKMICSDVTLAAYDLLLARQYNKTRSVLLDYPKKNLKHKQRLWLKKRDKLCRTIETCILAYEQRISLLKTIYRESGLHLYQSNIPLQQTRLTHIDLDTYIAHMVWVNDVTHHLDLIKKEGHQFLQSIDLIGDSDNLEYGYKPSLEGKFLSMRDYNKDGHKDLLFETASGSGGQSYEIWLYNDQKKIFEHYGHEQQGHFYPREQ